MIPTDPTHAAGSVPDAASATTVPTTRTDAATEAEPGPAFDTLALPPAFVATLTRLGYLRTTPIQAAALPAALAGHDVLAQARTGSGKTAAFALPLLARLDPARFAVQALVLCPTRELADQVAQETRRLAQAIDNLKVLTLCGGTPVRPQLASLAHGAHVVVGTPGRILDHLQRGSLALDALATLVLDEADRMLDMGFAEDIAAVVAACPAARQTLLFSATFPEPIVELGRRLLCTPHEIRLHTPHEAGRIRQRFYEVTEDGRFNAVARLLAHFRPESTLAFCNTRQQCRGLVDVLRAHGIAALALHGELDQRERDQVLVRFANRSCAVLVATDVAARGLDIAELEAVINVYVTPEPEVHIHRIGRTGRAGRDGWALSLASAAERNRVANIAQRLGAEVEWQALDDLAPAADAPLQAPMATLLILSGRKDKLRAGDVLGALTGDAGLHRDQVGRITVTDTSTYVAVRREHARDALKRLGAGRIKGRRVRVHLLDD